MFRMWKTGLMGFGLTASLALVGCASPGNPAAQPAAAAAPSTQAVACSKCQVTYVQVPTSDAKGRFRGYSARKDMEALPREMCRRSITSSVHCGMPVM